MNRAILIALMAVSAALIISCNAQQKTELKFMNTFTQSIGDIRWTDSTGSPDATWSGETLAVGSTNGKKEVKVEIGKADGVVGGSGGGAPVQLEYLDANNQNQQTKTLNKDEENTFVIMNAKKK